MICSINNTFKGNISNTILNVKIRSPLADYHVEPNLYNLLSSLKDEKIDVSMLNITSFTTYNTWDEGESSDLSMQ